MAIAIPAIIDTHITNLRARLDPHVTGATNTAASSAPPVADANRVADILDLLMGLVDSGTLTATTGAETDGFTDSGAFTGVNSLAGATFTYAAATTTVALRGVARKIISNTANKITFGVETVANQAGDTGTITFDTIDDQIDALRGGKNTGDTASNPYSYGPSFADAVLKILERIGALEQVVISGTADGAGSTTTVVDSGLGGTIDAYIGQFVEADDTGALDVVNIRKISDNTATVITVGNAFTVVAGTPTAPGATTVIRVLDGVVYSGTAAAGAASTLTTAATINVGLNELQGLVLRITGGTGAGQWRNIIGNTAGVSSVITVDNAWGTNPDATSTFEVCLNVMPRYVVNDRAAIAEPTGLLSPHSGGNGAYGHRGASLVGELVQYVRDSIARYTAPA